MYICVCEWAGVQVFQPLETIRIAKSLKELQEKLWLHTFLLSLVSQKNKFREFATHFCQESQMSIFQELRKDFPSSLNDISYTELKAFYLVLYPQTKAES